LKLEDRSARAGLALFGGSALVGRRNWNAL